MFRNCLKSPQITISRNYWIKKKVRAGLDNQIKSLEIGEIFFDLFSENFLKQKIF